MNEKTGSQIPVSVTVINSPDTENSQTPAFIVREIANPVPDSRKRHNLFISRGKPFFINGTVDNQTITTIQVWMLNGTVSTQRIPVSEDRTFRILLSPSDSSALPRQDLLPVMVVQYPAYTDNFTVNLDPVTRRITGTQKTPERIISGLNAHNNYPTTLVDYLEQAITDFGDGNSCDIYFLYGEDAWINLAPVKPEPPGTLVLSGTTDLPAGTPLSISVDTINMHPSYPGYDWSHEMADGSAVVVSGSGEINSFISSIDISRLNNGKYHVSVTTNRPGENDPVHAETSEYVEIIAQTPVQPLSGNYINWSGLSLPGLIFNSTMTPEMLDGEWKIVPPGTLTKNNEVPYGSIIDCTPDGICRVFDQNGVQFRAVYDSNQAHMMEVPDGASIDQGSVGNVTLIKIGEAVILTEIMERSQ